MYITLCDVVIIFIIRETYNISLSLHQTGQFKLPFIFPNDVITPDRTTPSHRSCDHTSQHVTIPQQYGYSIKTMSVTPNT